MDTVDTLSDRLLQARTLLRAFSPESARRKVNELIAELDLPLFAIEGTRRFLLSLDAPNSMPPELTGCEIKSGAGVALKNAFAKAGITLTKEPIMNNDPDTTVVTEPEPVTSEAPPPADTSAPPSEINGNGSHHQESPSRIFWTHSEISHIAERLALKIFTQFGPIIPEGRSASQGYIIPFLRESQSEMIACGLLPKNRRRDIVGLSNLPQSGWDIVKLTLEKMALQKKNGAAPANEETTPAPSTEIKKEAVFSYQETSDLDLVKELFRRFSPVAAFDDRLKAIEDMALETGSQLEKLRGELEERISKFDKRLQKKETDEKNGLPIVAVVGCRKDVFDRIEEKCREEEIKIDLRLYEQGTKERPIFADYAVCMKYLSHSWSEHAKKAVGKHTERFTIVLGSVDPVMNQIRAWFAVE